MSHQTVVILDFGSQTTQLIARRVREAGVYCEIVPCTLPAEAVAAMQPSGLILSGGPMSVYDDGAPQLDASLLQLTKPGSGEPVPVLRHLLRLAGARARARRRRGGLRSPRVRALAARRTRGGRAVPRRARALDRLDEPRRPPHAPAPRLPRRRGDAERADRRRRGRGRLRPRPDLGRAVPPRGGPHRARRRPAAQLRDRHLRLGRRLDAGGVRRREDRRDPRRRRRRPRDPGAERRRRLVRRGGAAAPRHRRAADLHLRGQRPAAARRVRAGAGDLLRRRLRLARRRRE